MSRSNRARGGGRGERLRGLILAAALLVVAATPAAADTVAILTKGPWTGNGLDWLGPNVIPYFAALYSYNGVAVEVTYAQTEIPPASGWQSVPCPQLPLKRVPAAAAASNAAPGGAQQEATQGAAGAPSGAGSLVLCYTDPAGWSLFFSAPFDARTACSFASLFVQRFDYFLGATQGSALSSFPAILQM